MKYLIIYISLLLNIVVCFAQSNSSYILNINAPSKILTYTGITTSITINIQQYNCAKIQSYSWDMFSDSRTILTTYNNFVTFKYTQAGNYKLTVTVTTGDNKATSAVIPITVVQGTGLQQLLPHDPITFSNLKSDRIADGKRTNYAIIVNGVDESCPGEGVHFYTIPRVKKLYNILLSKGFESKNIYYLNGRHPDASNPQMNDVANITTFKNAYNDLMTKIDPDDFLFLWLDDHGNGYFNPEYNLLDYQWGLEYRNASGFVETRINLQKQEYLETNFKLKVFNDTKLPMTDINPKEIVKTVRFAGLNKWFLMQSEQYKDPTTNILSKKLYRAKFVSHLNFTRSDNTKVIDTDPYIEMIVDYLKIDTDRDGIIQATGGSFNSNNDGSNAFSLQILTDGHYIYQNDNLIDITDESKWQEYYNIVQDNIHDASLQQIRLFDGSNEVAKSYLLFDAGMDDHLDIDIVPLGTTPSNIDITKLHADGTDLDSDGIIDGVDFNENGSKLENMGVDPAFLLSWEPLLGSELKNMLNMIPTNDMFIGIMACHSGGFVSDISKKGRVIMTATTNGSLGLADDGDHFIDGYDKNTLGFEKADGNSDGNVTMLELYNYAINQNSSTYHRHQYDDNGDGNSQQNKITSTLNGDGCTGSRMTINGWADSNQNIVGPINSSVTKDATIVDITNSTISNNSTVQVHSKQSTITNTQVNIGSVLIIDNNVCQ